jgi:hypothetical protein
MTGTARLTRGVAAAGLLLVVGCGHAGARSGIASGTGSTGTRETAGAPSGRTPATSATQHSPVWLDTVQMVSARTGWALIWTSNPARPQGAPLTVARTTDGGREWTVASPPAAAAALKNGDALLEGVAAKRAWLAVAPYSGRRSKDTLVFATGNGGATWSTSATVRGSQPVAIDFVSPRRGWLLESAGAAMGQDPVRLYRSTDGGARWSDIASSAASATDSAGRSGLPVYCDKVGMAFSTAQTGWITGDCNSLADAVLRSAAGGKQWMSPGLPLAADVCMSSGCEIPAPEFAGTATFLEISAYPAAATLLVSANDGATWQTERLPAGAGPYPRLRFFSATKAIAVSAGSQGVIERDFYLTTNGGQSWTAVRQGKRFGPDTSFDFVSQGTGLAWNDGLEGPVQPRLFLTTSSGRSWRIITPVLS